MLGWCTRGGASATGGPACGVNESERENNEDRVLVVDACYGVLAVIGTGGHLYAAVAVARVSIVPS